MNPEISGWITFWEVVLAAGLGSFFLLVVVIIPLGARDLRRLFAKLDDVDREDE